MLAKLLANFDGLAIRVRAKRPVCSVSTGINVGTVVRIFLLGGGCIMKKIFLALVTFFAFLSTCMAEDIYIAQDVAGDNSGADCANAHSMEWFNTAENWGLGDANTSAGDTVHFCGTITTTANVRMGGAAGNPITLKFESGAKFSKAAWGNTSSAAILINKKNYIVIDGDNVGIIENTDSGTSFAAKQQTAGIYALDSAGLEIKNLTIQNLYQRIAYSNDSNAVGFGIYATKMTSCLIHDNIINNSKYGIFTSTSVARDGMDIYNNTITKCSSGIVAALEAGVVWSNINIYNNRIAENYIWAGTWGAGLWHHNDGIHTWGNYAGAQLGPLNIYNNTIGGDMGDKTSGWIYLENYNYPVLIYNNVLYADSGTRGPTNGYIYYKGYSSSATVGIYNNELNGPSATGTGGNGIYLQNAKAYTVDIQGNSFSKLFYAIYDDTAGNSVKTLDYNSYDLANLDKVGKITNSTYSTLAAWQTALGGCPSIGNDCDSLTTGENMKPNEPQNLKVIR